jgi:hypothetical protein
MYKRSLSFSLLVIAAITMIIANVSHPKNIGRAYAHILSSNENAALLAIFYQIQTEAELAQMTYTSNIALAQEHAENALELLRRDWTNSTADRTIVVNNIAPVLDTLNYSVKQGSLYSDIEKIVNDLHSIIEEFIYVYVGKDVLNNPTIQALTLADITNVVDSNYASAFGTNSSKKMPPTVGMSNMMANMMMTNMSNINTNNSEKQSFTQEKNNTHNHISVNTLTNISDYQTAQALAIQAQAIFNNQLAIKKFSNMTATKMILQLGEDIDMLKTSINDKAPYKDIMTIIHGRIHPLLIRAYNLR